MTDKAELERLLDVYGFRCERFGQDLSTHARAQVVSAFAALASAPASEDGLTAKQAWWAGYRAGKGLPPDTPRQDAVKVDISSARLVTHWPNGTPRDERDTASDPEGKLIHDPTEPLLAASAPVAGEAMALELQGVPETIKEGDGFWRSCTGCHELNKGRDTGPYSAVLGCHLGQGCSECGGIGAIWDSSDYQAMADDMARSMGQSVEAAPQASECECARKSKAVADSEAEL